MWTVVIALLPAFGVSTYVFGIDAIKVTVTAVLSCVLFEFLIQKFLLKQKTSISDGSAVITGILLAFNVPSSLPLWMVIIGSLAAIGIGKMSFGGIGNNIFNPALVGRVFLLISFPVAMTHWPKPFMNRGFLPDILTGATPDAISAATPLMLVKEGAKTGYTISQLWELIPSYWEMFVGFMGGSLGEVSALAILIGGAYMLYKKVISWHIPVAMIGTVLLFSGIFWLIDPQRYMDPLFHILTGGVMLGAVFMATDMVSSPMTPLGMIIYGSLIGLITVLIRLFGAYPEGVSFAILIMNAFVPLINKLCKPRRFGE